MNMLSDIIAEVVSLPMSDKLYIIEEVIKSIKKEEVKKTLHTAVEVLGNDYLTDKELTSFTSLDIESFYEAK